MNAIDPLPDVRPLCLEADHENEIQFQLAEDMRSNAALSSEIENDFQFQLQAANYIDG